MAFSLRTNILKKLTNISMFNETDIQPNKHSNKQSHLKTCIKMCKRRLSRDIVWLGSLASLDARFTVLQTNPLSDGGIKEMADRESLHLYSLYTVTGHLGRDVKVGRL